MDPATLRYAKTHEWCAVDGDVATVGLSHFAVEQLTDLVYLELPPRGTRVEAGETFGEVESVKAVSDLYAPVSGEIIEVNDGIIDSLETLADDPYDAGWLIKVKMSDPSQADQLMDAAAYDQQCADEAH